MTLKTKFDIIHDTIVRANDLADARGVDKCVLIISIVQNLNELDRMLKEEDQHHDAAIAELTARLDKQEAAEHENADAD